MISGSLGARRKIRTLHRRIAIGVFAMVVGLFVIATHDVFSHFSVVSNIVDENPENDPATRSEQKNESLLRTERSRPASEEAANPEATSKPKESLRSHFKP